MRMNEERTLDGEPWNAGRIIGAKPPLKPKRIWALGTRLQIANPKRGLAMFNLAIDSKLRGCDLVSLKASDVFSAGGVRPRSLVIQHKTWQPVPFELTEPIAAPPSDWRKQVLRGERLDDIRTLAALSAFALFVIAATSH
jgi:hypothetical protein